jgi:hypothetical protein
VSSIEPDGGSRQVDRRQEVACGLVITSSDGAELLELAKEVFNPMACFVPFTVIRTLIFPVRLRRNHRGFPGLRQRLQNPLVGSVAFIGHHDRRRERRQQDVGSVQVAGLTGRQQKARRIAESIDGSMKLGAQSASAASDRLVLPLFF